MKIKPLLAAMFFLIVAFSAAQAFAVIHGGVISRGTAHLWYVTFSYLVALTIEADRKSRKLSAPYEYSALVFFAWPFVVPYYLYILQGWRGVWIGVGFYLFSCLPDITAIATTLFAHN